MIEVSYNKLHELISKGKLAQNYAWEHYATLASRKADYTLYGPISCFLGAASPSGLTPARERKLTRKTRREKYTKYDFDQNAHLIRISYIYQYEKVYCVYHLFTLDDIVYGCSFESEKKRFCDERIEAIHFVEGKPAYYAQTSNNRIFCEFYEYPHKDKRICSSYQYCTTCELTSHRLQPNWEAPMGAPDSPVSVYIHEDNPVDLDFSKYLL